MKKIGLMTCYLNNFGACLQAYALQTCIQKGGNTSRIIKYTPDRSVKEYNLVIKFMRKSKYFLKSFVDKSYMYEYARTKKFERFRKQYLMFTKKNYLTIEDLYREEPQCDCFVVGSDQLWNPRIHGGKNNKAYFLDFVTESRKKVAYAPSIGTDTIPDDCILEFSKLLQSFYAVSVREKQGKDIISKISKKECRVVLDPTLLVSKNEWLKLVGNRLIKESYIFCYCFGEREDNFAFIEHVKMKTGMQIVIIPLNNKEYNSAYKKMKSVGPIEFLNLIANAALVITDSFHATAFSINLNVPFYSLLRNIEGEANNMNSRVFNILEMMGLQHRLIRGCECIPQEISMQVNFERSNSILWKKREEDFKFLCDAIEGTLVVNA